MFFAIYIITKMFFNIYVPLMTYKLSIHPKTPKDLSSKTSLSNLLYLSGPPSLYVLQWSFKKKIHFLLRQHANLDSTLTFLLLLLRDVSIRPSIILNSEWWSQFGGGE